MCIPLRLLVHEKKLFKRLPKPIKLESAFRKNHHFCVSIDVKYRITKVEFAGLGAGSTGFLSGSAASQEYERGGADLFIVGTNIYLEVTGPQLRGVPLSDPQWVGPDKIESARSHFPERVTFVIHWLEKDGTLRVIRLREPFFKLVDEGVFPIIHPLIRGVRETYVAIPTTHPCVRPWSAFIQWLRRVQ